MCGFSITFTVLAALLAVVDALLSFAAFEASLRSSDRTGRLGGLLFGVFLLLSSIVISLAITNRCM